MKHKLKAYLLSTVLFITSIVSAVSLYQPLVAHASVTASGWHLEGEALIADFNFGTNDSYHYYLSGASHFQIYVDGTGPYNIYSGGDNVSQTSTGSRAGFNAASAANVTPWAGDNGRGGWNRGEAHSYVIVAVNGSQQAQGHSWSSEWVSASAGATCTGNGYTQYSHKCNHCGRTVISRTVTNYATGHSAKANLVSYATCTSPAIYYNTCSKCGTTLSGNYTSGSALPHTYNKQIVNGNYIRSYATCTAPATYYYACSGCNAKGSTYYSYGGTSAHSYSKQIVTDAYLKSAATCTAPAVYYYACNGCNAKGTTTYSYGSEAGHSWNSGVVTTEPTVYDTGVKTFTCTKDHSHTKTEVIPKLQFNVYLGNNRLSLNSLSDSKIYQIYLGDTLLVN